MSRVLLTIPSLLFSIGTTPKSAAFRLTASNTAERLIWGTYSAALAEMLQAREVGEGGLRAQERHGERLFEERDAEMISR